MTSTNSKYKNDPFWFENINILFSKDRLGEFFPSEDMNVNEKMNALIRFAFYFSIVMIVLYREVNYFAIPLGFMGISYIIFTGREETVKEQDIKEGFYSDSNCYKPNKENPYMNYMVGDKTDRPAACPTYKNKKLQEEVSEIVNDDLYRTVDEVWQRKSNQRQFYTMPNTRSANDQKEFAEWCYGTSKTCKEGNGEQCFSNMSNNLTGNDLQVGTRIR